MKLRAYLILLFTITLQVIAFNLFAQPEKLEITHGTRRIYGIISRPDTENKRHPIAIISHGFNGTHHAAYSYFEFLNRMGYICYGFDFPCGSIHSQSDPNTMSMSIRDEQRDLETVIRYFRTQPDVDSNRIVLIGESQGGLISALTAAHLHRQINALILIYPALCIPDDWNKRYPTEEMIPDTTHLWSVPLGQRYFIEARALKVFDTIKQFKKKVLLIHGDKDKVVPLNYSQQAQKVYKKAHLHVIHEAEHGFRPHEQAESLREIECFLNKNIK